MNLLINPTIVIPTPQRKKQMQYFITLDKKKPNQLVIKKKELSGRGRGYVGTITQDGTIETNDFLKKFITPVVKQKINFTLEMLFGSNKLQVAKRT